MATLMNPISIPSLEDPESITAIYPALTAAQRAAVIHPQILHRIELIKFWDIAKGENVLEIGCGQGDTTVCLAAAVGEEGKVTAVDPGSLDYGKYPDQYCKNDVLSPAVVSR